VQTDGQPDRQTDRQPDRQTDRETDRQTADRHEAANFVSFSNFAKAPKSDIREPKFTWQRP